VIREIRTGESRHCRGNAPCEPIERSCYGSFLLGGKTTNKGEERNGCTTVDEEYHSKREVRSIDGCLIDLARERLGPVMGLLGNLRILLMKPRL
jgi:hypothetical protein